MHDYSILTAAFENSLCYIEDEPDELSREGWRIALGRRMGDKYPVDVALHMSDSHSGIAVPDLISNGLNYCLVSAGLRELLDKEAGAAIEWLSFTLVNHKGRETPGSFYIANVLDAVDCVDERRTEARESHIKPGTFSTIFRLVLDHDRIPENSKLFRLSKKVSVMIIRDDLRRRLEDRGITGVQYINMDEECFVT